MKAASENIGSSEAITIRQLKCLHCLAQAIEAEDNSLPTMLSKIVTILPLAVNNSMPVHAEIIVDNSIYKTRDFRKTERCLKRSISIDSIPFGYAALYIESEQKNETDAVFMQEEEGLFDYICERLGRVIQRCRLWTEIENKRIAIKEILDHIENDKNTEKLKITEKLNLTILPIIEKMSQDPATSHYAEILKGGLKELTSDFGHNLFRKCRNLTPREVEICSLLRNGKTSKEIGDFLSLSDKTINKHRDNIRIKMGIKNRGINLVRHLQTMN